MLAEPRKKRKWTLNPCRRNLWNRDDSIGLKFGKGLMEKMGWSEGKGLGANEQGIKQPLKVDFKNDTKGMGFKDDDDKWIQHQNHFNQLLNELTIANCTGEIEAHKDRKKDKIKKQEKIESLENKSQNSKARIHYYKFTRAKDVSTYSEKDLECILGRNRENSLESESSNKNDKILNDDEFEVNTVNAGSMVDYFSQKMKSKRNFSNVNDSSTKKNSSSLKEDSVLKTCYFNYSENCEKECEDVLETEIKFHERSKISKKKKKKLKFVEDEEIENVEESDINNKVHIDEENLKNQNLISCSEANESIKTDESEVIKLSKKRTKKGENVVFRDEVSDKRNLTEEEHNENIDSRNFSKKSKKKKHNEENVKNTENEEIIYEKKPIEDVKRTNKKKDVTPTSEVETLKKSKLNIECEGKDVNCEINLNDGSDQHVPANKKKKKNKKKDKVTLTDKINEEKIDIVNEDCDLMQEKKNDNDEILNDSSEIEPYKKKKKTEKMLEATEAANVHANEITYRKKRLKSFKVPLKYKSYEVKTNKFVGSNLISLSGYGTIKYVK